jgi:aromatic ring-cleaving dioxygenase
MTTVHERIKLLMESFDMNVYKFAKEIGEDRAEKFYNIIKGKMKPNFDTMYDIGQRFPEVNFDWLIMDRGSMLLTNLPQSGDPDPIEEPQPTSPLFVSRIDMLEQQLADRDKMIEILQSEVEFLREVVKK